MPQHYAAVTFSYSFNKKIAGGIMNKYFLLTLVFGFYSQSATINATASELYIGEELLDEHSTGKTCYLYVDQVNPIEKGQHCYSIYVRPAFATDGDKMPKDGLVVSSRITNYHRSEYPSIKTCAMSLDGKTSGNDIYQSDDSKLYNDILGWNGRYNGSQFDFFVSISPVTKLPVRTRFHKLNWYSEKNYDCINLKNVNSNPDGKNDNHDHTQH